jgi:hypothetical protein
MDTVLLGEALPRLWVGSVWSVKELQKSTASWTVISLLASETAVKFARDVLEQTKTQHNNIARHEISRKQFTLADSLTLIRKARPEASPNLGFIASLRALEKSNGCVVQAEARMKARNKAA